MLKGTTRCELFDAIRIRLRVCVLEVKGKEMNTSLCVNACRGGEVIVVNCFPSGR